MSEKRFKLSKYVTPSSVSNFCDENGRMLNKEVVDLLNRQQTSIETMLENMEKLEKENKELGKNFDDIVKWASEIAKRNVLLDERIGRLQQEEKLYAQEILRLNTLLKQYQANQDLGGGY